MNRTSLRLSLAENLPEPAASPYLTRRAMLNQRIRGLGMDLRGLFKSL